MSKRDIVRMNEAFLGYLGDQATVDVRTAYDRYVDVCDKYGDDSHMAFPPFVDAVAALKYVSYENATGDVHFLLNIFLVSLPSFSESIAS